MKTTWRKLLVNTLEETKESFANIESSTLTEAELDTEFDNGSGLSEGSPFTVWTKNYVYFPAVYDGAEWVARVPRNPNGYATYHVGDQ
jgi:hypothetical protein